MRKSKFSEHQIIAILKAVEAGRTVKDVCREQGLAIELDFNLPAPNSELASTLGSTLKPTFVSN